MGICFCLSLFTLGKGAGASITKNNASKIQAGHIYEPPQQTDGLSISIKSLVGQGQRRIINPLQLDVVISEVNSMQISYSRPSAL